MNDSAMTKVLVVDDDNFLRESIATYLEDSDYTVVEAENGRIGLEKFRNSGVDVVLLDLRMPEMDGLEVLQHIVKEAPELPVIIVSGMGTMNDAIESLRLGAWDYITKPIHDMAFLEHAINRGLERARMTRELREFREHLVQLVEQRTAELNQERSLLRSLIDSIPDMIFYKNKESIYLGCNKAFEKYAGCPESELIGKTDNDIFTEEIGTQYRENDHLMLEEGKARQNEEWLKYPDGERVLVETLKTPYYGPNEDLLGLIGVSRDITERWQVEYERRVASEKFKSALVQTIQSIAMAMEKRDPYTSGHQQRVSDIAVAIATEMGLPDHQIEGLRLGGLIHDIGKIHIPAEILNRPGKISDIEFSVIKTHSQVGYEIVKDIEFPWPVSDMVHQHHERLDGSGYPNALKGDEIILEARILAVSDVIEAMASHRPYRPSVGLEPALEELQKGSGKRYDEKVVEACMVLFTEKGYEIPELKYR